MKNHFNNKKGFSLVEIIGAIIILGLLSVGIMSGLGFAQSMTKANMERNSKMALVQEVVDELASRINQTSNYPVGVNPESIPLANLGFTDDKYQDIQVTVASKKYETGTATIIKYNDIPFYEINASLEYETQNGTDMVSITRLAAAGVEL